MVFISSVKHRLPCTYLHSINYTCILLAHWVITHKVGSQNFNGFGDLYSVYNVVQMSSQNLNIEYRLSVLSLTHTQKIWF